MPEETRHSAGGNAAHGDAGDGSEVATQLLSAVRRVTLAEAQTGVMVALMLDEPTAAKLAIANGVPAAELHVTLAFLGDAADLGELGIARAAAAVDSMVRWRSPIAGTVSGYGRFQASEDDGKDVFYASPDIAGLEALRGDIVQALAEVGVPISTAHGFTPHISLAYLEPGSANPVDSVESLELRFAAVSVVAGSRRIDVPFFVYDDMPGTMAMSAPTLEPPLEAPIGTLSARPLFFSASQEWIPFLPVPGRYSHALYGTLDLTPERYERILANFRDNTYGQTLPINAEHDSIASGAIGWIRDMRLATDGSLEVRPEWNDRGTALIEGDRFRYVSAEFAQRWQDPVSGVWHTDVPVGLAVCTRPHFKTDVLRPLAASERAALESVGVMFAGTAGEEVFSMPELETAQNTPTAESAAAQAVTDPNASAATAAPAVAAAAPVAEAVKATDLLTVVLTAEQRREERQLFADLQTKLELSERETARLKSRNADLERERRVERFTAEVRGRSAENDTAWFGSEADNVAQLVSLAEKHGDESSEVKWTIEQKRNEARAINASGIFQPLSKPAIHDTSSAAARQLAAFTEEKRRADPNLTAEQAQSLVFSENPKLYEAYLAS